MPHDVVIVGAGPGGSAAALALAQRGVKDVLLLDRDPFPRDKTCGSGLSPNALKVLDGLGLGEEVRKLAYPIMSVRIVTPGGKQMVLASNAAAVVLLRRVFDNLLVEKAQSLGVKLTTGFRADRLIKDDSGRVTGVRSLDGVEHHGRFVLCADGAHSIFSTDPRPKRSISTLMGWWEDFAYAPGQLDMIFDKNVSPLYGWMFPEGPNRVNIGICVDGQDEEGQKSTRNLRQVFQRFLDDHYGPQLKQARPIGKWKGHPIVYTNWVGHCTAPGALFLGEAARITHNATGEGIYQAMQSGVFAADSVAQVLKGEKSEAKAWNGYVWEHRKRFTAGFLGGLALRAVVASPILDNVAGAYNHPTVRKAVVKLLGSALAGSSISEVTTDAAKAAKAAKEARDAA
ncbi:MAG: putative electron transfer oxidoreductase [Myxococcaceae bacterium]|nr:putative electron transfer oxidoreductase [Myxococcaceae bacterium]